MLADLTPGQWVAFAWIELIVVYVGYLLYLRWLERKKPKPEGEQ